MLFEKTERIKLFSSATSSTVVVHEIKQKLSNKLIFSSTNLSKAY
ncbi:hypothetical protein [Bullifex porci]|nr:hypothetical protein [Bullifex porci]